MHPRDDGMSLSQHMRIYAKSNHIPRQLFEGRSVLLPWLYI